MLAFDHACRTTKRTRIFEQLCSIAPEKFEPEILRQTTVNNLPLVLENYEGHPMFPIWNKE